MADTRASKFTGGGIIAVHRKEVHPENRWRQPDALSRRKYRFHFKPHIAYCMRMAEAAASPRLLVVEDDLGVRRLVETTLSRAGFSVEPAVTGSEALEKLRRSRYDLVLLDLWLPWLNGFEVLAKMRDDPHTARVPVVVITGALVADSEFEADAHSALVRKPFDARDLVATVRAMLSGKKTTITH